MPISKPRLFGLTIFIFALGLAFLFEWLFKMSQGTYYFVDHFLFGIGFPFLVYSAFGWYWLGFAFTLFWSVGNEFWEDQLTRTAYVVDWDHFVADMAGLLLATVIYKNLTKTSTRTPRKRGVG